MTFAGMKRALLVITLLGFAVRFGCLQIASPVRITGDEVYFSKVAINIARGTGHTYDDGSKASWPPANSYFMSWFINPQGAERSPAGLEHTIKLMMVGQVIMGTLLVPLVMMLAGSVFDRGTAIAAGLITALYPTFVAYSHYLWAENVFIVLVAAGLIVSYHAERSSGLALTAIGGAIFGLAALSRETGLVIAIACGLWLVWCSTRARRKRAVLRAALMVLVAILVVLPWTIRNYRATSGLIPISTTSWMAMAEGNILDPADWLHPNRDQLMDFRASWRSIPDETARMEFSRQVAIENIRKEQPAWLFKKVVRTSGLLLSPDSFLFKKISRGAYGDLSMITIRALLIVTVTAYIGVAVFGLLGIAISPETRQRLLPLLVVGSIFAVHVAAFTSSRYRLPIMTLLIPYAAYAITHRSEIRGLLHRRRWVVPVAVLVWFFTLCVPYFLDDAVSLWTKGTYTNSWRP